MFIKFGSQVTVSDLLNVIIFHSGNDASVALADHIAGSEDAFADMMNKTVADLGMTNSHFMNPTGLPNPEHYSSAHDMALLARAIIHEDPAHYAIYSQKEFFWNGIKQPNRNLLLWRDKTVDGLKTGHTDEAGYCLVSSAVRDGMRLIAVVFGTNSEQARAAAEEVGGEPAARSHERDAVVGAQDRRRVVLLDAEGHGGEEEVREREPHGHRCQ